MKEEKIIKILVIPGFPFPVKSASTINVANHAKAFRLLNFDVSIIGSIERISFVDLSNINYRKITNKYWRFLFILKIITASDLIFSRHFVYAWIASIFRKRVILDIHAHPRELNKGINLVYGLMHNNKRVFKAFISTALKEDVIMSYGIGESSVVLSDVSAWQIPNRQPVDPRFIVYFGNVGSHKNLSLVIELALRSPSYRFKLFLIGGKLDGFIPDNIEVFYDVDYLQLNVLIYDYAQVILIPNTNEQKLGTTEIGRYTSPLKFFDSLALNKKVIINDIVAFSEFKYLPNVYVTTNSTVEGWLLIVNDVFCAPCLAVSGELKFNYIERCKSLLNLVNNGEV
jgi:hypothetical protein